MIKNRKPLSMSESIEFVKGDGEKETEIRKFMKEFVKVSSKKAKEIREKINKLDLLQIKEEHISSLIDTLPKSSQEINKIFSDVNLDEDETNKILEILEEYR
ncbi:MAG: hypothetical protein WDZ62_01200 [Candidatus Pacearchaeota archaeon]